MKTWLIINVTNFALLMLLELLTNMELVHLDDLATVVVTLNVIALIVSWAVYLSVLFWGEQLL